MVDKVRPLKLENPAEGGTEIDFGPTETRVDQDYLAAKGISYQGSESTKSWADSGIMKFVDTEVTSSVSLQDLALRLKLKDVDLTNLLNGYVLTWNNTLGKFELQPAGGAGGGSGVTPPFVFSKDGNCTVGTYLRTGTVPTNTTGQDIKGSNYIVEIRASNSGNAATTTRIQFVRRTAVSTFVDITNAYVDIPAGNYRGENQALSIAIGPEWEVGCYIKSGSTLSNVVCMIFLIPQ
jgi:hypothetical protein